MLCLPPWFGKQEKNLVAVRRSDSEVESRSLRAKLTTAQFFDSVIPGHAKREL